MAKLGRPTTPLVLSDSEREELVRLTRRARVNRSLAFRARIVLGCADQTGSTVAARLHTTNQTVSCGLRRQLETSPSASDWSLRENSSPKSKRFERPPKKRAT